MFETIGAKDPIWGSFSLEINSVIVKKGYRRSFIFSKNSHSSSVMSLILSNIFLLSMLILMSAFLFSKNLILKLLKS